MTAIHRQLPKFAFPGVKKSTSVKPRSRPAMPVATVQAQQQQQQQQQAQMPESEPVAVPGYN
ncbi:MAG: hypothetical protein KDG55_06935 [Rhodocyclaceae bacterium]|nr:hypothetical protein [Rhodocyclaceae bacterium]